MIIESITSKRVDPKNGVLETIEGGVFNPLYIMLQHINKGLRTSNFTQEVLLFNQAQNLMDVIDLAQANLTFSSGNYIKFLVNKMYNTKNPEEKKAIQEKLAGDFLLNSLLYYNASFDYLEIFLIYKYASLDNLHKNYTKERVEKKLKKMQLEKSDWIFALGKLLSENSNRKKRLWYESKLPEKIKNHFRNLRTENLGLREGYGANRLKHMAVPCFEKTDKSNAIGMKYLISLQDFYNKKTDFSIKLGVSKSNLLQIDKTQKFLIKYHNLTFDFLKLIN